MSEHRYTAEVRWERADAVFTDNRYSRGHTWHFDGGVEVPGSSSPLAAAYAEFRPTYPDELLDYIAGLCARRESAWDCACGSGQATLALAERFDRVIATDASAKQIEVAPAHPRVSYRVSPAENS